MCTHVYLHIHTDVYIYIVLPACKAALQGSEEEFDEQLKEIEKYSKLLVHHIAGNQSTKKKFEALVA